MTARHPFAARFALPVAVTELVIEVALGNDYCSHRDELCFRTAARHPAFGYDDQPPLTPLLGWVSETVFGEPSSSKTRSRTASSSYASVQSGRGPRSGPR